jgi:hypothetical protein
LRLITVWVGRAHEFIIEAARWQAGRLDRPKMSAASKRTALSFVSHEKQKQKYVFKNLGRLKKTSSELRAETHNMKIQNEQDRLWAIVEQLKSQIM